MERIGDDLPNNINHVHNAMDKNVTISALRSRTTISCEPGTMLPSLAVS